MRKKVFRILCIIFSAGVFMSVFYPWTVLNGENYTIIEFYKQAVFDKQLYTMADMGGSVYLLLIFLIFPMVVGILSGVKAVLLVFRKNYFLLGEIINISELISVAAFFAFQGYELLAAPFFQAIFVFLEFMMECYLSDVDRFTNEWEIHKIKNRAEKEERKQRLAFPGNYDRRLRKIIRKDALHPSKAVVLVCIGNGILLGSAFALFAVKEQFQKNYSAKAVLPTEGLNGILTNGLLVITIFYIFFAIAAFFNYVHNHQERRNLFWTLGSRERLNSIAWKMEYEFMIVLSMIPGYIIGVGIYNLLRVMLKKELGVLIDGRTQLQLYFLSGLLYLCLSGVIIWLSSILLRKELRGEKRNIRKLSTPTEGVAVITVMLSLGYLVFSIGRYMQRRNGESLNIFVYGIILGGICVLCSIRLLESLNRRGKAQNFQVLLDKIPMQSGFFKEAGLQSVVFAFHFIFLGFLSVTMAGKLSAPSPDTLFPHEYVCMAYPEDEELFTELRDKNLADVKSYPMIRVTSVQGNPTDWIDIANNYYRKIIWPQGQHIGISRSTYESLCTDEKKNISNFTLSEDEIYVVYQEDCSVKAHPLEWYMNRRTPFIKEGQPLRWYNPFARENYYPPRKVIGQERKVLTGVFERGIQEHIVVFSDDYFNQLHDVDGPSVLYFVDCLEKNKKEVEKVLSVFASRHMEDSSWDRLIQPYYSKTEKITDMEAERKLEQISTSIEMLLSVFCVFIFCFIKIEFEQEEKQKRFQTLFCLGMHKKQVKHSLWREICLFIWLPLIFAYTLATVVVTFIWKMRFVTGAESRKLWMTLIIIWTIYLLLQMLLTFVLYRYQLNNLNLKNGVRGRRR